MKIFTFIKILLRISQILEIEKYPYDRCNNCSLLLPCVEFVDEILLNKITINFPMWRWKYTDMNFKDITIQYKYYKNRQINKWSYDQCNNCSFLLSRVEPSPMNVVRQDSAPLNLHKIDVAETLHWKVRSVKTLFPPSHRRTERNCWIESRRDDWFSFTAKEKKEKKKKEKTGKRKRSITSNKKGPRIRTNQSLQLVGGLSFTMLAYRLYRSKNVYDCTTNLASTSDSR